MTNTLSHRDKYYRNYRLSLWNEGKPTAKVHIRAMGDSELLSIVPTEQKAREVIDEWIMAP